MDTLAICPQCGGQKMINFFFRLNRNQWPRCCRQKMQVGVSVADVNGILESIAFRWQIDHIEKKTRGKAGKPPIIVEWVSE